MKSFVKALVLVAFALLVFATPGFSGDTVKIGVGGVISGDLAPYGISSVRGCEIAVDDLNAKGGILGKKVKLIIGDDVCKPEVSVNMAMKLVSDGAQMIVGHVCSGATLAANKIYKDAHLLVVSPASTNDGLTFSGDNPNFFRTISYDGAQAELMATYGVKGLKGKKFALIHDKGDYGKGLIDSVKANLEKLGAKVVLYEGFTTGAVDYTALVQKIKRSRADVTMYGGYHSDASKIVQLLVKKRVKTTLFGPDGIIGDNFTNLAGKYAEGVYATGPNDTSSNPMHKKLIKKHQKKYGEDPGTFFFNAYAAVLCLANAAEKAGSLDYDKMRAVLLSEQVETPIGKIGFDKKGDVIGAGFSAYKVVNGKYKQVN